MLVYQCANTIRPWGPHLAKTLSKNLLPLETALFPLARASVNYQYTCYRLYFSHQDSGCVNPAGKNPHQAQPISDLQAVHMWAGQVLLTAASLVLLDPTELPDPKKEKCWRMVKLQRSGWFTSKKIGGFITQQTLVNALLAQCPEQVDLLHVDLCLPHALLNGRQSSWCRTLNNTRRKTLPASQGEQACLIPMLSLRESGSKHKAGPGADGWAAIDVCLE